ncbi:MAG: hypothetical protein ACKVHE_13575 [Planctomycetales bacterium]
MITKREVGFPVTNAFLNEGLNTLLNSWSENVLRTRALLFRKIESLIG